MSVIYWCSSNLARQLWFVSKCDNIQINSHVSRAYVLGFVLKRLKDFHFFEWIPEVYSLQRNQSISPAVAQLRISAMKQT